MGLAKLTAGHVAIIGAVLAILCGTAFFYLGPYKTNENLAALKQRDETADRELLKEGPNKKDLNKAKQEVAQVKAQFAVYDRTRMPQPPIDLTKPTDETAMTKGMIRLWGQPYEICTIANRFARESAKKNHVTLVSPPFSLAGQTTDPAAIPTSIIIFPLGTIQVIGSFQNVGNYMKSWNRFKRVVAVDGYQLSAGPNPSAGNGSVTGQATLTCYIFPHASETTAGGAPGADTSGYGYGATTGGYPGPGGPGGYMTGGPPGPGGPGGYMTGGPGAPPGGPMPPGGPGRPGGA